MATMKLNGANTYAAFASADLTTKKHYLAKIGTDGLLAVAGSGEPVVGSIFEGGNAAVSPTTVQTGGLGKAIAGAAIVAGVRLQSDGNGAAITLAGGVAFGLALTSASTSEIVEFAFDK